MTASVRRASGIIGSVADAACLPLADDALDAALSFGVIAYTEDPEKALREIVRVVRPGGLVGLWVAPSRRDLLGRAFSLVRATCRALGPRATSLLADAIVPLLSLLPTRSGVSLRNATWRQCREVVLVNIAPPTLWLPELEEVRRLVTDAGLVDLREDAAHPVTIWARVVSPEAGKP